MSILIQMAPAGNRFSEVWFIRDEGTSMGWEGGGHHPVPLESDTTSAGKLC